MKNIYAIIIALLIFLFPSKAQDIKPAEEALLLAQNERLGNPPTLSYNSDHPDKEKLKKNTSKSRIFLMPNAQTKDIKILFKYTQTAKAVITVNNEKGKTLLKQDAVLVTGNNQININRFSELKTGTYYITLSCNNEQYHSTFMVW